MTGDEGSVLNIMNENLRPQWLKFKINEISQNKKEKEQPNIEYRENTSTKEGNVDKVKVLTYFRSLLVY
jgi:hypothetical protein